MSYFMQSGDAFFATAGKESVLDSLPVGNYLVAKDPMSGMFFKKVDQFADPGRIYGDLGPRADRIINTFLDRPRATGVLLAGEKGSGKSLLARIVSHKCYDKGIATILVNQPWVGDEFNALLATVEQPAVVILDEFEKVYNKRELQEQTLTLLDGTMTTKKLFILTVNDKWAVNDHMRNRPGRLFYSLDFNGLDQSFVEEYCNENLKETEHTPSVLKVSNLFENFNFDMLKALVEEMNRYDEDPFDAMTMLNAKPVSQQYETEYAIQVWRTEGGEEMDTAREVYTTTPLTETDYDVYIQPKLAEGEERKRQNWEEIRVGMSDVVKIDGHAGIFEFEKDGYTFVFTKKPYKPTSLRNLAV